jgi:ATP-dependent 26S proteasome regulatory subunit
MKKLSQGITHMMIATRIKLKMLGDIELNVNEEQWLQQPRADDTHNTLHALVQRFSLNAIEQQVLVLCLAVELDSEVMPLLGQVSPTHTYPTLALAKVLQSLESTEGDPPQQTLSTQSSLFQYQLIEQHNNGNGYLYSPINLVPDVLDYLIEDLPITTTLLRDYCQSINLDGLILASEKAMAASLLLPLVEKSSGQQNEIPAFKQHTIPMLLGTATTQLPLAQQVLALAVEQKQQTAFYIDLAWLPNAQTELTVFRRAIERELKLQPIVLLFHTDEIYKLEPSEQSIWLAWLETLIKNCPKQLVLTGTHALTFANVQVHSTQLRTATLQEQETVWQHELASNLPSACALTHQFNFDKWEIVSICQQAMREQSLNNKSINHAVLIQACQQHRQYALGSLVTVIPPSDASWDDIVLEPDQKMVLQAVVSQVQQQHKVYHQWGFAPTSSEYGLGISVLLSGSSGTGKTFAARIMASQLQREIYQINLSQVADKYIGETEKKLEQIFSSAQHSGAVLLFDEADALFGQRSKITDSKDRNANLAVSYLLQQMESYKGIAILTTNFKSALDSAFMRRIRFMIQFKFPDQKHRKYLWQQMFPEAAPTKNLDFSKLARLHLVGGSIRNIVLQAAFNAATDNADISMMHLKQACQQEYDKTDKALDQQLIADWV